MAWLAAAKLLAPTVGREALEGGVKYAAGQAIGRAASRGLASVAGQRLAGRVAGQRVATALASKPGQKAVSYYTARETRQTLNGEDDKTKPAPMPTTPVSEEANPNLMRCPGHAGRTSPTATGVAGQRHHGQQVRCRWWWRLVDSSVDHGSDGCRVRLALAQ